MSFFIGFILGNVCMFVAILGWVIYAYARTAEEAHKDGYENPYL